MPGEHDAALDRGDAYQEFFGEMHYTFDHKGVHFIVLDNVSDPTAAVGEAQLDWLRSDLEHVSSDARIVVLTHRPLFDLAPAWDWATRDGDAVIDTLLQHQNVTVLYGHIHQEHHHMPGRPSRSSRAFIRTKRTVSKLCFIFIACFEFFEFPNGEGVAAGTTRRNLETKFGVQAPW